MRPHTVAHGSRSKYYAGAHMFLCRLKCTSSSVENTARSICLRVSACVVLVDFTKPTRWFAPAILPMARPSSRCTSSSRASLLLLCTCLWRRIRAELALSALGLRWRDISLTSSNHQNQIQKHQNAPESNPMHQNQIQKNKPGLPGAPVGTQGRGVGAPEGETGGPEACRKRGGRQIIK